MAKPRKTEAPAAQPINTYGINVDFLRSQLDYDRAAFVLRLPFEKTGMTRLQLFRKISDVITPGFFEWQSPWTVRQVENMLENRWIGMAGCSGSSKTRNAGGFAVNWWLMAPGESAVIVCSTSLKAMKRRIWSEIQAGYQAMPKPRFGNFVDSKLTWQATYGDEKHAIIAVAVEEGEITKAADKIKGHHTKRLMVIIDEATAIPPAIFDAVSNLYAYPASQRYGEFIMVVIGNPRSKFDQMGLFCQPKNGWNSVTLDDEEWETTPKLDNRPGICIRFDALKSPNITRSRIVSQHLPTKEMVEAAMSKAGSANDPAFWSNWRGFWPPDGIAGTVFNESMLEKGGALNAPPFQFTGRNMQVFGGFDPSYGGKDTPSVRFGRSGELVTGGIGIQLLPKMRVTLDARSSTPIQYQLAYGIKTLCEQNHCPPRNLNIDDSGNTGVGDICFREWSREVMRTRFGENASDAILDQHDGKKAKELYRNKAAEIWFSARDYVMNSQVRGLDMETAAELCGRYCFGGTDNAKIELEPKEDYKGRHEGRSCDDADALCLMLDGARRRGVPVKQAPTSVLGNAEFAKETEAAQKTWGEPEHEPVNEEDYEGALV